MNYSIAYQNPNFQIIGLLNEHLIEKGPYCLGGVWGYQENNETVLWPLQLKALETRGKFSKHF